MNMAPRRLEHAQERIQEIVQGEGHILEKFSQILLKHLKKQVSIIPVEILREGALRSHSY